MCRSGLDAHSLGAILSHHYLEGPEGEVFVITCSRDKVDPRLQEVTSEREEDEVTLIDNEWHEPPDLVCCHQCNFVVDAGKLNVLDTPG